MMARVEGAVGALAPIVSFVDNFFYVEPVYTFTVPTPAEFFGLLVGGICLYSLAARGLENLRKLKVTEPTVIVDGPTPPPFAEAEYAEDYGRLVAYGRSLMEKTDHPLMREKIATVLAGKSVNH